MKPIRSDEELIDQFLTGQKDDSENAFETLVRRYGPMVLGVCRSVLRRDEDAEDAFQTAFLALARRAATIRDRRMLSCWLHEVAYRIALRARARASRRRAIERRAMAMSASGHASGDHDKSLSLNELRPVLRKEMDGLPVKYGIPVILGYIEGKTNQEVADLLNWPIGTVKGRLSRARDMLRARLSRRGVDSDEVRYRWG
jgi:RNA polymerase sigma factor (sigma-70 family)